MIHIYATKQGSLAIFTLSPDDRRNFGFPEPHQLALDTDGPMPIEALAHRWLLIATMLTGLTETEVETEGFTVSKFPKFENPIPVPTGTVFQRTVQ